MRSNHASGVARGSSSPSRADASHRQSRRIPIWLKTTIFPAITGVCIAAATGTAHAEIPQPAPVVRAENRLAIDLYKALRRQPGNLLLSPYSIGRLLGMVYAGAKGDTAAEIAGVLHWCAQDDADKNSRNPNLLDVARADAAQIKALVSGQPKDFVFLAADALWVAPDMKLSPDFSRTIQQDFSGTVQRVDFSDAAAAAGTINQWVKKNTHGKITDIIDPDTLSPYSRLALTDAVYFKASWASPFEKSDTTERSFHVDSGTEVTAAMMYRSGLVKIAQADGAQVLVLPYKGNASMVVVLPERQDGLADLEATLSAERLDAWLASATMTEVKIWLPTFQSATSVDLSNTLKTLGMRKAFSQVEADFTGIELTPGTSPHISQVLHKAFIDTDEGGTEAAASTSATFMATAMPPSKEEPVRFMADHPFLYFIRDNDSGVVLFVGRVANPAKRDDAR
ncbi:serpin family protein [Paraburkholderia agricolaris]|uniref:Serpin family protein n=1 Tax=Paraburkholderia agricolaris TaxID=2152888 RepID=A0ABW8ZWX4_9BURK